MFVGEVLDAAWDALAFNLAAGVDAMIELRWSAIGNQWHRYFSKVVDEHPVKKGSVLSWMTSLVELSVACAVSAGIPVVQRNSGCQRKVPR